MFSGFGKGIALADVQKVSGSFDLAAQSARSGLKLISAVDAARRQVAVVCTAMKGIWRLE